MMDHMTVQMVQMNCAMIPVFLTLSLEGFQ